MPATDPPYATWAEPSAARDGVQLDLLHAQGVALRDPRRTPSRRATARFCPSP